MRLATVQGKVVNLPKPSYTRKLKNSEQVMNTIRWEMYHHYPIDLAHGTGKSVACIYAIRSGRTAWPRGDTFFALIDYLGLRMRLEKE